MTTESATESTTVRAIMEIVKQMPLEEKQDLLSYLEERDLYTPEVLARIRNAEAELERGEFVTQEEFEAKYPL